MSPATRKLIVVWIVGAIIGTLCIAVTAPLFVRSYTPLKADQLRGVWTLSPSDSYRWRSEGYADSVIGVFGMPGRAALPASNDPSPRVALWGDSQAEGCCVADDQKIFAQAQHLAKASDLPLAVLPLARSGEDARDWLSQIPRVEGPLKIDVHVFLIVDLPDLLAAAEASKPAPSEADISQANRAIAKSLPAFVIQAARNLLTNGDGSTPRQLRFSIGPLPKPEVTAARKESIDWQAAINAIIKTTDRPVVLIYAPVKPLIVNGKILKDDVAQIPFGRIATEQGLIVVDVRDDLLKSANEGIWPHGFQNGQFGVGHLNETGNQIVAQAIVRGVRLVLDQQQRDAN